MPLLVRLHHHPYLFGGRVETAHRGGLCLCKSVAIGYQPVTSASHLKRAFWPRNEASVRPRPGGTKRRAARRSTGDGRSRSPRARRSRLLSSGRCSSELRNGAPQGRALRRTESPQGRRGAKTAAFVGLSVCLHWGLLWLADAGLGRTVITTPPAGVFVEVWAVNTAWASPLIRERRPAASGGRLGRRWACHCRWWLSESCSPT